MRDERQFFRRLTLLELLPPAGRGRRTVKDLQDRLAEKGLQTTARTVQRDLVWLKDYFPIDCTAGLPAAWYWEKGGKGLSAPYLEPALALILLLGLEGMAYLLPPAILEDLGRYRQQAEQVLANSRLGAWRKRIAVLSADIQAPPRLPPQTLLRLAEALESRHQVHITYRRGEQSKDHQLSVWGLGLRDGVLYLAGCLHGKREPALFAAHRISRIALLEEPATLPPSTFVLEHFLRENLQIPRSRDKIGLQLQIDRSLLHLLQERPLSEDQRIGACGRRWCMVTATVEDSEALRWWMLSFGENLRVLAPRPLFDELRERTRAMAALYARSPGKP